jgi:hypothetical protein
MINDLEIVALFQPLGVNLVVNKAGRLAAERRKNAAHSLP